MANGSIPSWETIQRAHAIANGCYVAVPNRTGLRSWAGGDGIEFWGQSFVADPAGEIIAKAARGRGRNFGCRDRSRILEQQRTHWPFLGIAESTHMPISQAIYRLINRVRSPMKKTFTENSPAGQGYRMPAEWESHEATWLSWPRREESVSRTRTTK